MIIINLNSTAPFQNAFFPNLIQLTGDESNKAYSYSVTESSSLSVTKIVNDFIQNGNQCNFLKMKLFFKFYLFSVCSLPSTNDPTSLTLWKDNSFNVPLSEGHMYCNYMNSVQEYQTQPSQAVSFGRTKLLHIKLSFRFGSSLTILI